MCVNLALNLEVSNEGVDQHADEHLGSTNHESLSASTVLHHPETTDSCNDVDATENDRSHVRIRDTTRLEDGCAVIEEEISTGQLLTCLKNHAEKGSIQHSGAGENFVPGVVTAFSLGCELDFDLVDLGVDEVGVGVDAVEESHVLAGFIFASDTVCETRGFGHEEDSGSKDDGPECGKTVGNTPLSTVGVGIVGSVVDLVCVLVDDHFHPPRRGSAYHVGSPNTKGDQQLITGNDGTTDVLGHGFGLVHGDGSTQSTNTQTGRKSSHGELHPVSRGGDFDNNTNDVEECGKGDGEATTDGVAEIRRSQTTNKRTGAENSNDGSLTHSRQFTILTKSSQEI